MKTRKGFVSNSSSTNFIIAFKDEGRKTCPCCQFKPFDYLPLLMLGDKGLSHSDKKSFIEHVEYENEWLTKQQKVLHKFNEILLDALKNKKDTNLVLMGVQIARAAHAIKSMSYLHKSMGIKQTKKNKEMWEEVAQTTFCNHDDIDEDMVEGLKIPENLLNIQYSDFEIIKKAAYCADSLFNWKKKENASPFFYMIEKMEKEDMDKVLVSDTLFLRDTLNNFINYSTETSVMYNQYFKEEYNQLITKTNEEIDEYMKERQKEMERRAARKKRHDQWCKLLSTPIARFFTAIFGGIGFVFSLIFVKFLWQIVWKKKICFIARQIKIFAVYMFVVLRELKHGACPYIVFVDPPTPEEIQKAEAEKNKQKI